MQYTSTENEVILLAFLARRKCARTFSTSVKDIAMHNHMKTIRRLKCLRAWLSAYDNHEINDYDGDLLCILRFSRIWQQKLGVSNRNRNARRRNIAKGHFVIERIAVVHLSAVRERGTIGGKSEATTASEKGGII